MDGARQRPKCGARAETERRERRVTGGPAQCQAAVPLIGGSGLSAARACGCSDTRGPAREEKEMGHPDAQ
jgi:hypothetical protein